MSLIRLSSSAFVRNLSLLRDRAANAEIAAVLKDNAYGHGLSEMAALCAQNGVKYAIVRNRDEAKAIAPLFDEVLILADEPSDDAAQNVSFALNDERAASIWASKTRVHLKIDGGMHRNGVAPNAIERTIETLWERGLILRGVFSHLRSADVLSSEFFWQEKNFALTRERIVALCDRRAMPRPLFHLRASAGAFRAKTSESYDLIRPGIALYGYCDLDFPFEKPPLKPVLSLWAHRIARRELTPRDRVGYGGVFEATGDLKAGIYDVGYGDGFLRLNGLEGYKTPEGKRLLGRVSMDNMAIEGDDELICVLDDAQKLAKLRATISYEVLVRLSANIKREIV
ncbi:MAG: alanine racemase [Helicobacteraceae bacterium]|nr:alanine racemase [Helicobacteraceae bacterium]